MRSHDAVRLVAAREFTQRLRDRSFLVSTAITVIIVAAVAILPQAVGAGGPPTFDVGVTGADASALEQAVRSQAHAVGVTVHLHIADAGRLRAGVRHDNLDAAVVEGAVVVKSSVPDQLAPVLQNAWAAVRGAQNLRASGLDAGQVTRALRVAPLATEALEPKDPDADAREAVAGVGTFVLYGQLIGYGVWVALGVVEEKSSRVVELLLSTISARSLLAGKVLGIGLLGLLQLSVVGIVGLVCATVSGAIDPSLAVVPAVAVVLGWFVLGFAFYACLFAAAAARVSRQEELQNATTPLTMVLVASFLAALWAGGHEDAVLARVLGVVPPFSALVQPSRWASGQSAAWEAPVAVVLMIAATLALVGLAARVYEGAVLRMGQKVPLRAAFGGRSRT